ncbi:MAG: helix-turn-helix domain-containing protein [Gammaproteobacteria bacterium]|nr:helix-turn-helix domain-containing protein [Gammaproteobacteria bacterium]MDH5653296.1 helix-turn-helix domain-containing protein [Gammaproteobacteria bacterium]
MSDKIPRSQFSTEALRSTEQFSNSDLFDAWEDAMSIFFRPRKIEDIGVREKFCIPSYERSLIDVFLLPGMLSAQVSSSGYHFSRSERDIAKYNDDAFLLTFWEDGHYCETSNKIERNFSTGNIHVTDLTRTIQGYSTPHNTYGLFLSRELLMDLELDVDRLHLTTLHQNRPVVRLLRRHMFELHKEAAGLNSEEAQAMTESTSIMIKTILSLKEHQSVNACKLMQRNQLLEVRHYIDNNLYDPNLSPEKIAREIGVSRAQLYRLAEPLNGVKNYIRRRRLKNAFYRLVSPQHSTKNITKLSYDLGFKSEDAFRRAFTQVYLMSPKEARASGLQAYYYLSSIKEPVNKLALPVGDLLYKQWMDDLFS